jgi:tetratricopeptide (TPR) repeat protein
MGMKRVCFLLGMSGVLMGAGLAQVDATVLPAIPDKDDAAMFAGVPDPWRAYLRQAREAERIEDPLQRCLAFPDLPLNHWPEGHAAAHCRHHFSIKRSTLDEIEGMVQRGEVAQLETLFDASLQRHYAGEHFSDDLHDTFNYLLAGQARSERVGVLSEAWLRQAPDSAYAHLARAAYFNGAAWKARGGQYASDTPRGNMHRMSALVEQAIPHFEKAVEIEPRLIAAYTGMIDIGMLDSRPALEARARRAAEALDPACPELANTTMRSLQPRWGGSYEEMLVHASRLSAHLARRPHLAIYLAQPLGDQGDLLLAQDPVPEEALEVLEAAIAMGSDEDALKDAGKAARNVLSGPAGGTRQLAYFLQVSRFREVDAWTARMIGSLLMSTEPEWSLRYSQQSLALEPDNTHARLYAGAAYQNMASYDAAAREFEIAAKDQELRQQSLRALAELHLFRDPGIGAREANAARAKPYIDMIEAEFPGDARIAVLAFYHGVMAESLIDEANVRALLAKLDRTDPWQAQHAERLDRMLKPPAAPGKRP